MAKTSETGGGRLLPFPFLVGTKKIPQNPFWLRMIRVGWLRDGV